MINFKAIRWKNLLSTGNQFIEVRFDRHRTSLIVGTNGAGKSTILDALMFVLFNKPFRKVNKGQLINSIINKALLVEVEFTMGGVDYLVRRGSKPNVFEIHKNGTLVDQNAETKDYQGYLETVLGMNQKAFSQIVILGAASFVPFMQLTVPARREVIEDLLDIQVFSSMKVLLKARMDLNKNTTMEAHNNLNLLKTQIKMTEEFNKKQAEGNQGLIDTKQAKIDELTTAAIDVVANLEENEQALERLRAEFKKVYPKDMTPAKRTLENELMSIKQELASEAKLDKFLHEHDTCPTCKQNIDDDFKASFHHDHDSHHKKVAERIKALEDDIDKVSLEIQYAETCKEEIRKAEALSIEFDREVNWYQKQVENLMSEIETLKAQGSKALTDVEPMKADVVAKEAEYEALKKQGEVLAAAQLMLKDDGIKSVIIKQYVPIINDLINKYLASMDFFVDFRINESFEETIKSRFRDEFSYESFSEGEKMRIDLAVLFAWRTVAKMRNSAATNLLIFDEVLDSSLDQYGIDEFLRIIQSLTDQENIFIISHRGDAIGDKFDNVLKFTKVKGFSQLTEAA